MQVLKELEGQLMHNLQVARNGISTIIEERESSRVQRQAAYQQATADIGAALMSWWTQRSRRSLALSPAATSRPDPAAGSFTLLTAADGCFIILPVVRRRRGKYW